VSLDNFKETLNRLRLNEDFDRILDFYKKVKHGEKLKPSEEAMMRSFKKHVDNGGGAEDFIYNEDQDISYDEREGDKLRFEKGGMLLVFTFSEEYEDNGETIYFGEIKYMGDEFLGEIATDKRGYIIDYDFYSVFDENVRLQDLLRDNGNESEIMNFFAEEVIPELRR
jgi:hypothetical protein